MLTVDRLEEIEDVLRRAQDRGLQPHRFEKLIMEDIPEALSALHGLLPRRSCLEGALSDVRALLASHENESAAADPRAHDDWARAVCVARITLLEQALQAWNDALDPPQG